jgi:hypothetical protein
MSFSAAGVIPLALGRIVAGEGPVVASALHAGHELRPEIAALMALTAAERRREEDPHTERLIGFAANRIELCRSRFEVDANRARERCVYREPAEAWGLQVWQQPLPHAAWQASLALYDDFYAQVAAWLRRLAARHGRFVILDVHSYNHRRAGPAAPPADPAANPELDIGTGTIVDARWRPLLDRFIADLRQQPILGRLPDVRENVKWPGLHFASWVHATFPGVGCLITIEVKKTFMDEWTGTVNEPHLNDIRAALAATVPGLAASLRALQGEPR